MPAKGGLGWWEGWVGCRRVGVHQADAGAEWSRICRSPLEIARTPILKSEMLLKVRSLYRATLVGLGQIELRSDKMRTSRWTLLDM
jgi:hypothetical protein